MARKSRCVFGCDELGAYLHRFPHPQRRSQEFAQWISIVGGEVEKLDPVKVYKIKRVCDYHFETTDKTSGHRLIKSAKPTLYLRGVSKSLVQQIEIEHNYSFPRMYFPPCEILQHHDDQMAEPSTSSGIIGSRVPITVQHHADQTAEPSTSSGIRGSGVPITGVVKHSSQEAFTKQLRRQKREERKLKSQLLKMKRKEQTFKVRLAEAEKTVLQKVTGRMLPTAKELFGIQFHQSHKKPKGRRFTISQKILCLSLYKRSPRVYPLLSKYFVLPSAKSLKSLLSDIKISPGVNQIIFEKIKDSVADLTREDRLCTLMFDEMSITPQVIFQAFNDEIRGFADNGRDNETNLRFANHVLVFMIKGIKNNFKQPVAYYFTNCLKSSDLKKYIKDVIRHVHATGLRILCTVCDQGSANTAAINGLVEDTKRNYLQKHKEWRTDIFEVQNLPIIPMYDVPHLLKGLRNNMLTKDLIYTDPKDNRDKRIKWSYFQKLYEADKSYGELRCIPKLTEEHVIPEKISKMRVKLASQVFSHSVAVATEHLTARNNLPAECRDLIPFVLIIDKLFDSLNASSFNVLNAKIYRAAVKRNSPHHKFWQEALKMLKSVKFVNNHGQYCSAPSVKNLIKTITSVRALWSHLNIKYGVDSLLTRNLNQDPIENFFGGIRSLGVRNTSPNFVAFEGAYKTLLINNLTTCHAIRANCEKDENVCLENLHFYLNQEKNKTTDNVLKSPEHIMHDVNIEKYINNLYASNDLIEDSGQSQYVCGFVIKKCFNKVKGCKTCKKDLFSSTPQEGSEFIRVKEYNSKKQWLVYPTKAAYELFSEIQNIVVNYLKDIEPKNVKSNIKLLIDIFVNYKFNCLLHKSKLKNVFTDAAIDVILYSWCRSVNRILSGKITYEGDDPIKVDAQVYFKTHKVKKNK